METSTNHTYHHDFWEEISNKELNKLKNSGISINNNDIKDTIQEDGTFTWKGQKVIVYIKDQWVSSYGEERVYKYHISNCSTLIQMRSQGRFKRYVISNRHDGFFEVILRSSYGTEKATKNLNICKNCISTMQSHYPKKTNFFNYINFDLKVFLNQYYTKINPLPHYNSYNAPENIYPENWKDISLKYRVYRNWKCEKCGKDCSKNKSNLHSHHIGPKHDSSWSNLKALCKQCHKLEPGHQHMI